jgi:hypothetical protein
VVVQRIRGADIGAKRRRVHTGPWLSSIRLMKDIRKCVSPQPVAAAAFNQIESRARYPAAERYVVALQGCTNESDDKPTNSIWQDGASALRHLSALGARRAVPDKGGLVTGMSLAPSPIRKLFADLSTSSC